MEAAPVAPTALGGTKVKLHDSCLLVAPVPQHEKMVAVKSATVALAIWPLYHELAEGRVPTPAEPETMTRTLT